MYRVRLTTVSRAPCWKFGWNCINLGSVPGSPCTKPLKQRNTRNKSVHGMCSITTLLLLRKYEMQTHITVQTKAKAQKWGWFLSWTQLWLQAGLLLVDHLRQQIRYGEWEELLKLKKNNTNVIQIGLMGVNTKKCEKDLSEALQASLLLGPRLKTGSLHQHWQTN